MSMILVDGVEIKDPSSYSYALQDVSAPDSGRTTDSVMHKNRVAQKVKISLQWNLPTPEEASAILQAFQPEYFEVTYPDTLLNENVTKTFYRGDITAPVKFWMVNNKRYESISFNIIER